MAEMSGLTLWESFRRSLETNHDRPAITAEGRTYSYSEISRAVASTAARLADSGVERGSRVALLMDQGVAFPVVDLAVMALGAVKVPLNPQLSAQEIAGIIERVTPAAAVVSMRLSGRAVGFPSTMPVLDDELSFAAEGSAGLDGASSASDPAVVYFTGGTTGLPKGIVHSQAGVLTNLWAHLIEGNIGADERMLLTTPMAHAAGLFAQAALLRGAYLRVESSFSAEVVLDIIESDEITWTFAVPTMIYRMLDAASRREWQCRSLRTIQYGGAPIAATRLREALDRFGPVLQQLYAQTECPNYGCVLSKADHVSALERPELLTSCGRPSVMCDASIRDDDGVEVGANEHGEICLRSPYTMTGYWDDDEAFQKRFFGAWLRTGDLGFRDPDDNFFIVDRKADMIVTGGLNVYSLEVEQELARVPGVAAVAVIGIPHDDWGEAVHAVVIGDELDERALESYARAHLATYKRPKSYEIRTELPLTSYGKVDRKQLRAPFWGGRTREIN